MSDSSIKSAVQFRAYKIDNFNYAMKKNLGLLELKRAINPELWEFQIAIRPPVYYKNREIYLCGIDSKVYLLPTEGDKEENALAKVEAGIVGTFGVEGDELEEKTKDLLVKVQMPSILMPYLRGTITTFLSNCGYSSVIFPLVNIQELAKEALKEISIQIKE